MKFFLLLGFAAGGSACERVEERPVASSAGGPPFIEVELLGESPLTRSSCAPDDADRIRNLNVWVYQDGALFKDYSYYSEDFSGGSVKVFVPNVNASYDVYFLANSGRKEPPPLERDIGDFSLNYSSYSEFKTGGFPMAASLLGFRPEEGRSVKLEKLVGRYKLFVYRNPSNSKVEYHFNSGRMKACARTVRPFAHADGGDAYSSRALSDAEIFAEGDTLSAEDIAALNAGDTVSLYYLENCQGRLLPGNSIPRGKNAEAVAAATGDAGRASLCSYLELGCRAVTPTVTYANVIYRAYLGQDLTSDFSVRRGTSCRLRLDLVSDRISESDWFVEPGDGTVTGKILFCNANPFEGISSGSPLSTFLQADSAPESGIISDPSFYIQNNLSKIYYVYCNNPEMDYSVIPDIPAASYPFVSFTLSPITRICSTPSGPGNFKSEHWRKLSVSTEAAPDSFSGTFDSMASIAKYGKTVTLNFSSYDSLVQVPLEVGVVGRLQASFDLAPGSLLRMRIFDPMGYTISDSNIGSEAFAAGSHYWYSSYLLDYDSPFWALFMRKSKFGPLSRNPSSLVSTFVENYLPSNTSNPNNTLYFTMYMANAYQRRNNKSSAPQYADADLVYGRVNTMDLVFECPEGYVFRNATTRDIPLAFSPSPHLFDGKFYPTTYKWEGIYVLNGKILDYSPSGETRSFVFEKNKGNQVYTLNLDRIYDKSSLHGSPYRDALPKYGGTLVYGAASGLHNAAWWNNYPYTLEEYWPQHE